METISRMFLSAGCLQYPPQLRSHCWKASEICSSSCVSHFTVCQASQSGICIEGIDLGKIQRKPTEDLFSIQQLPIVISRMDPLHLLKRICCGNHLIIKLVHLFIFINIVSRVGWKDICGIASVKDSNKKSFISFPKVSFLVFTFFFPTVTSPTFCLVSRRAFSFSSVSFLNILQGASIFHNSSGVCLMKSHYSVELSTTLNHAHLLISPCLCCQHNAVVVSFKNCSPGFFSFLCLPLTSL